MARWGRAARLLTAAPGSRVLDLGCAFGYGTAILARRYQVIGQDISAPYINRARRRLPGTRFVCGAAERVLYPDGYFDAAVLLDVLEHVVDEQNVLHEVERVLRPGGELVLSVPHAGAFARLDSLNLYRRLFGDHGPAPTDDPSWSLSPRHRHYAIADLQRLLGPNLSIEVVQYTGLGLAEAINFVLLVVIRRWLHAARLYEVLQYLYFAAYILEDELSLGRASYHVMVRARRLA